MQNNGHTRGTSISQSQSQPHPPVEEVEMDGLISDEEEDREHDEDEEAGLTHSQRKARQQRTRTHTTLSERFAPTSGSTSEEQMARHNVIRRMVINAILIGLWYTFSISISVYNKWMFDGKNLNFPFPLFVTSLHMIVQFACASTTLFLIPRLRPKAPPPDHRGEYTQLDGTHASSSTKPQPIMTPWFYATRVAPCSTATALDIGLGNFSLRFIQLTFYTMCKSSVLAFVLLFAFIFRLETPTWRLCVIIAFMTVGVIMMVAGESAFNATGFVLVMSASFCSGFRWSLTQILLLRNPATSNPFSSIFFLTPVMFGVLFVLALPIEGPVAMIEGLGQLADAKGWLLSIVILVFPGTLAFMMVAAEFALLQRTSVVTLSVCGIFKEVLTISAAGIAFDEQLSPINISGLVVTIASIAAYNYLKYSKMKQDARKEVSQVLNQEDGEDGEDGGVLPHKISEDGQPRRGILQDSLSLNANGSAAAPASGGISISPVKRLGDME